MTFVHNRGATFALAAADPDLRATLSRARRAGRAAVDHIFDSVEDAVAAFHSPKGVQGTG